MDGRKPWQLLEIHGAIIDDKVGSKQSSAPLREVLVSDVGACEKAIEKNPYIIAFSMRWQTAALLAAPP
jgi:hypothetical protein